MRMRHLALWKSLYKLFLLSLCLRPVSTQENKHRTDRMELDCFPSCIINAAGIKKVKILQLFIIRVDESQVQTRTENWHQIGMRGFCSDPV